MLDPPKEHAHFGGHVILTHTQMKCEIVTSVSQHVDRMAYSSTFHVSWLLSKQKSPMYSLAELASVENQPIAPLPISPEEVQTLLISPDYGGHLMVNPITIISFRPSPEVRPLTRAYRPGIGCANALSTYAMLQLGQKHRLQVLIRYYQA